MAEENKKLPGRWDRLKDPYRLVVLNDETFEEVRSFKLSLLNLYVILSTLMVVVALLVWLLIAYTPVKRLVPGYGTIDSNGEMVRLYEEIDSLEQMAKAQQLYNEAQRRRVSNEVQYAPEELPAISATPHSALPKVERSKAENELRNEVEMDEIRGMTGAEAANVPVNVSPRDVPLEQMYFTSPITGSISLGFDIESRHIGVDVVAPKNTPIKAAMDGWVIASDWTLDTGNTIAIQHTNNIVTFYKHNSVLLKKAGDYVRAGEAIAIIGNTGELTDGPHLHFELWHRGVPMNPQDFINFR